MKSLPTAFLLGLLLAARLPAQQADPAGSYRTVQSAHFRVTYSAELDTISVLAVERAEEAYDLLQQQLARAPRGRIDLLLSDNTDAVNAFAMTFPSNRILVFVKPPVADLELQHFRDWLDLVITHELAHIFHLDVAGSVGRGLRALFGRVPLSWPFFPALDSPDWMKEGLAVEFETRGTGAGRSHGAYHEMVVRTAILEDAFDPIDRVSGDSPIWPGGTRVYIYGSLFMDYLARKHGKRAQAELVRKTASSFLPPRLVLNRIGNNALGSSLTDEYDAWQRDLHEIYEEQRDSLVKAGLTRSEQLTSAGRYAQFPRVSRDGRLLAIAESDGRSATRTRVIDLERGRTAWTQRRNSLSPADWLPDGSLITAQLEFGNVSAVLSDLFRVKRGNQDRLTKGARIEEPDADSTGERIIAVQTIAGANRLVLLDGNGRLRRALNQSAYGTGWSNPRFSPDGKRIAVERWRQGGHHDLLVIDTLGTVLQEATSDEAVDATPAWSANGRYVLFWSDRTGIPNIFALDTQTKKLAQVTSVLTGAFHPEVSPDGKTIYFSAYHADGFHIERMPFDTATWRDAEVVRAVSFLRPREPLDSAAEFHIKAALSDPRGYRPWRSLLPRRWFPFWFSEDSVGTFYGGSSGGVDLIGRHSYQLSYAHDFERNRNIGSFQYQYAGLRNPTIGVGVARDWDFVGFTRLLRNLGQDTSLVEVVEREDVAELATTFLMRRVRWSFAFTVGAEAVHRKRMVNDTPGVSFTDGSDRLYGPVARMGFANYRQPAYAISREDGITLQVAGRWRMEPDTVLSDRGYREVTTFNTLYRSFSLFGFAHHVIGLRASGLLREGSLPPFAEVGGVPGGTFDLGIASVGAAGGLLPVRGFEEGDRLGTRAWSASLEYRLPLALVGRGVGLFPLFLDRMYLSGFLDAGDAECSAAWIARSQMCQDLTTASPLVSAGAELGLDAGLLSFYNTRIRIGIGQPLSGPRSSARAYITFGSSF